MYFLKKSELLPHRQEACLSWTTLIKSSMEVISLIPISCDLAKFVIKSNDEIKKRLYKKENISSQNSK